MIASTKTTTTSQPANTIATASAKLLDPVIQVARHSQQDPSVLLAAIGIEPDSIGQAGARIPAASFSTLLKELAQRTENPRLALRIGEATQPRMLGSVGFLMSTATNLGQAYQLLNDYLPLLIEGLHLSLEQDEEQVTLVLDLADDTDRALVEWFMACLYNWTRWLTGKQVPLTQVDFAFAEPASPQQYEQFFAAEVSFNTDRNRLCFAAKYLDLSCLDANDEMQRLHQTFADQLLSAAGRDGALVAQIKSLIRNRLSNSGQAISRQQVADSLNLSLRTMQRKLDQQGTHFQALFDQTRKDLAMQLIQRGDRSFGEIAFQLGFSSLSAFQKAFKRWTGMAPGGYRRAQRPKTLTPYRSQPQVLADLITPTGLGEERFYPLALQLLELVLQWHQRGLKRLLLSPAHIGIVTDDLLDYQLTLVGPEPGDEPSLVEQLAYEAPEASLALPYAVDDRSELYQLGCLFYCLLHGQPPYIQTEPGALLQAHLQQSPLLDSKLSLPLTKIIDKLLAVPAEERYQSIAGLQSDLKQSQLACQQQQPLTNFEPGCGESPERIIGAERLVGREAEQQKLQQLLQNLHSNGHLLLIEGPTGSGKSCLIESLRSPLFLSQGALLKGRFKAAMADDIELFVHLARQRLRHKLALPQARRDIWAQRLLHQLGPHAALLQQLLPELSALFGQTLVAAEIDYSERRPLQIEALAKLFRANRDPLVIFIDDLHHAGTDGLNLLQRMIEQLEQQPLLLVISCDAAQVPAGSPIKQALQSYQYHRLSSRLSLGPLPRHATRQLLQSLFKRATPELTALADWLYQRTGGLPGALAEELDLLRQQHWLRYQPQQRCWQWQPEQLPSALDHELEKLLTDTLTELPAATLTLLQWAAVIGDQFELELLAQVRQDPLARVTIHLWPAQQAGLVQPQSQTQSQKQDDHLYSFSHPALRQQLLQQIASDDQAHIHWTIGDALQQRSNTSKQHQHQHQHQEQEKQEPTLLQRSVEHLNQAYQHQPQPQRQLQLARLNLEAGRSAATLGKLNSALNNYQQAYLLLDTTHDDLVAELLLDAAELAYRYCDRNNAMRWLTKLQQHQPAVADTQHWLPLALAISQLQQRCGSPQQSIQTLINALSELGIFLPRTTDTLIATLLQLLNDDPSALPTAALTAPPTDDQVRALLIQLQLLAESQLDPLLYQGSLVALAQLSSDRPTYPTYIALLQLELLDQTNAARRPFEPESASEEAHWLHAKLQHGARISPWIEPLQHSTAQLEALLIQARRCGQQSLADLCTLPLYNSLWLSGEPLNSLRQAVEAEQSQLDQSASPERHRLAGSATTLLRCLTDATADKAAQSQPHIPNCPWALTAHCALAYLLDNRIHWPILLAQAEAAQASLSGLYAQTQLLFFTTLMEIELALQGASNDPQVLIRLRRNQSQFQHWSTANPAGFDPQSALIDAEMKQLAGDSNEQTQMLYEHALQVAETANCAPLTALAFERFAVYCRRQQQPTMARLLRAEASKHYQAWGATAKLAQL
ncbi:MAG: AraC family transcriptional regulator ligand-binding domain-containing protein [Halopseudomonas sp.]